MKKTTQLIALSASLAIQPQLSSAQEAPWGCEVLLCAASSAPSWQGVPYCVPPMTKLIAAMKLPGFKWPTCPGAGTGAPGFDPYDECPSGYLPTVIQNEDMRKGSQGSVCAKRGACRGHGDNQICEPDKTVPRPLKENPYYFDIPNGEGGQSRAWFNLKL